MGGQPPRWLGVRSLRRQGLEGGGKARSGHGVDTKRGERPVHKQSGNREGPGQTIRNELQDTPREGLDLLRG